MIENEWLPYLKPEFSKPYYAKLYRFVNDEYKRAVIYPAKQDVFRAYEETPIDKVKVLILGQDPYHEPGQAHGLCFSVMPVLQRALYTGGLERENMNWILF